MTCAKIVDYNGTVRKTEDKNMQKITKEDILYTLGEFLMTESDGVEDVRYPRGKDCFYVVMKDGRRLEVNVREV